MILKKRLENVSNRFLHIYIYATKQTLYSACAVCIW